MSNLTHFLNRLITDGGYKTVLLIYDGDFVGGNNFVSQLTDSGFGNYATMIMNVNHVRSLNKSFRSIRDQSGLLQIIMLNYDDDGENRLKHLLRDMDLLSNKHNNMVILMPAQRDDQKKEIWRVFARKYLSAVTVIFYQTEKTLEMANTSRIYVEVFILNYKANGTLDAQVIDVENTVDKNQPNESNLNEKIFGPILQKPKLFIFTDLAVNKSVTKTTVQQGQDTLVSLGNADYYMSNFIARNLRFEDGEIHQILVYLGSHSQGAIHRKSITLFICDASNENIYGELYNKPPKMYWPIPISCVRINSVKKIRLYKARKKIGFQQRFKGNGDVCGDKFIKPGTQLVSTVSTWFR